MKRLMDGKSFRNQYLSEADFSECDIRGFDFRGAILEGANFTGSIGGLTSQQKARLIFLASALAILAGIAAGLAGSVFFVAFFNSLQYKTVLLGFCVAALLVFAVVKYGYIGIAATVGVAVAIAGAGVGALTGAIPGAIIVALILVAATAGAITGAGIYALIGIWSVLLAMAGSICAAATFSVISGNWIAGLFSALLALVVEMMAGVVANSAMSGNERLYAIKKWAILFSSIGGTSFQGANLANANFAQAQVRGVNFKEANLYRTDFQGVVKLDLAVLDKTSLQNSVVRDLCVTRNGYQKDFSGLDLSGLCLKFARLDGANLKGTRILGTDLSQASITAACIQEWNINNDTQLEDINCDFCFLKQDINGHFYEPKPDSGCFKPGYFAKWAQELQDTVDLIFEKGLDGQAFAFSLVQSAVDIGGPSLDLSLQSIENKGEGYVIAKLKVSEEVNKEQLHQKITGNYELAVKALHEKNRLLLEAKDNQIESLQKILDEGCGYMGQLISSLGGRFSLSGKENHLYFVDNREGRAVMSEINQSKNISVGGDLSQNASTLNLGDISGEVSNVIEQVPSETLASEGRSLKKLLLQLKAAIESESLLNEEDKIDLLEQLKTLSEAQKIESPQEKATLMRRAGKIFSATLKGLPDTARIVESCGRILPLILG